MLKKIIVKIIIFLINLFRPFLGTSGCCIYPVTCRTYAKETLNKKPLYLSLPLIFFRVISCNPLTALIIRLKWRWSK